MNKKIIVIPFVLLLAGLAFWGTKEKKPADPKAREKSSQKDEKKYDYQWVDWEDPAGFSFQYPKRAGVDNHPEDKDNYAYLTFSNPDHPGEIIVTCNDSQYEDLDAWLKNDEEIKEASSLKTKIASVSARKLISGKGKEMIAFIDRDKVFYTIEIKAQDQDYWQPVYKQILDSFKFIPLEGETEAQFEDWFKGFDTSGADVVEPVEVIQ